MVLFSSNDYLVFGCTIPEEFWVAHVLGITTGVGVTVGVVAFTSISSLVCISVSVACKPFIQLITSFVAPVVGIVSPLVVIVVAPNQVLMVPAIFTSNIFI